MRWKQEVARHDGELAMALSVLLAEEEDDLLALVDWAWRGDRLVSFFSCFVFFLSFVFILFWLQTKTRKSENIVGVLVVIFSTTYKRFNIFENLNYLKTNI